MHKPEHARAHQSLTYEVIKFSLTQSLSLSRAHVDLINSETRIIFEHSNPIAEWKEPSNSLTHQISGAKFKVSVIEIYRILFYF